MTKEQKIRGFKLRVCRTLHEAMPKTIIDVCCGSRMFYYDKENQHVLYCDERRCEETLCDGRRLEVNPDMVCDFTSLPFPDDSFHVVVFDPPHLIHGGKNSWLIKKYGKLPELNWKNVIHQGFMECFRVLKDAGVLIFKWSDIQISCSNVLPLALPYKPLLGDIRGKRRFIIFVKDGEK